MTMCAIRVLEAVGWLMSHGARFGLVTGWWRQQSDPPVVDVSPSAEGLPGGEFLERLLAWLAMAALWGSLAAILAGAGLYGLSYFGQVSSRTGGIGKMAALGGAVGAVLSGLAVTIVNGLYRVAGG
jgi:hypothetical protein